MAEFYDEMAIVAAELINEFGRELTLVKESRTPEDPDKPWRGTDDSGAVSVTVKGAVVGFDDDLVDGDMIRRGDLDAWVEPKAGHDFSEFDYVLDEGRRLKIMSTRTIRPANTTVAYRLQLRA